MVQLANSSKHRLPARPEPPTGGVAVRRDGLVSARAVVTMVLIAGVSAVLVARWWTTTGYQPALFGLPDAGRLTAVGLPIAHFVQEFGGVAVVGVLFLRTVALTGQPGPGRRHLGDMAARWAWVWVGGAAVWVVLTVSDLAGVPAISLVSQPDVVFILLGTNRVLAETATLWVALLVALFARQASTAVRSGALMLAAAAALLPSALSGHAGHHNSAVLELAATITLGVHIVAATIWVGGLLALIVHLRRFPDELVQAVRRFSFAALICVAAVGLSGVLESAITLDDGWAQLWASNRGHLILAKTAALGVLTAIGYQHRRRSVAAAGSGRLAPLLRLGAAELMLMSATVGLAVVLSTTA